MLHLVLLEVAYSTFMLDHRLYTCQKDVVRGHERN